MFGINRLFTQLFEELSVMKKITLLLLLFVAASALLLTSCASKNINVQVVDGDGNVICNEDVRLGAENELSIEGVTTFGIDCLEAALIAADIDYYIEKEDTEAYVLTNVGDIACDTEYGFKYYVKGVRDDDYVDKSGLTAQHDYVSAGDKLMFKYEALKDAE